MPPAGGVSIRLTEATKQLIAEAVTELADAITQVVALRNLQRGVHDFEPTQQQVENALNYCDEAWVRLSQPWHQYDVFVMGSALETVRFEASTALKNASLCIELRDWPGALRDLRLADRKVHKLARAGRVDVVVSAP